MARERTHERPHAAADKSKDTPEAGKAPTAGSQVPAADEAAKTVAPVVPGGSAAQGTPTRGPANPVPAAELTGAEGDAERYDPNEATGKARPASQPPAFDKNPVNARLASDVAAGTVKDAPELEDGPGAIGGGPMPDFTRNPRAGQPQGGREKYTQASDAAVPLTQLGFTDDGPITVGAVVQKFFSLTRNLKAAEYWAALDDLGDLLKMARPVFSVGQHATVEATTARARDEAADDWQGLDHVRKELDAAKGRAFGASDGGGASGTMAAAVNHAYVAVTPGDVAGIIQIAEMLLDLFQRFRSRRGV